MVNRHYWTFLPLGGVENMLDHLLAQTIGLGGTDADLVVVTVIALALFVIGGYLLITRGSGWHVAGGLAITALATLYILDIGDIFEVESIWNGELLAEALRFVGLG